MNTQPHDTAELAALPARKLPRWQVRFAAATHAGKVRQRNEDHYLVSQVGRWAETVATNLPTDVRPQRSEDFGYVLVVADGMGGMTAGQQASRLAILTGIDLVMQSPRWYFHIDQDQASALMDQLGQYFRDIDRRLSEKALKDASLYGMGTTLTGAYLVGGNLFVVHVGDSRCYLFREGHLQQLTRDHTLAQELADAGRISQEDASRHRMRNVLTRYIGGSDGNIQAEVHWMPLVPGDRVMLCSDGLSGMVPDDEIALHLTEHRDADAACQSLLGAALEAGGRDNVTLIVADVAHGEPANP
jgi:serine/threonine protein phosphatase PrpC